MVTPSSKANFLNYLEKVTSTSLNLPQCESNLHSSASYIVSILPSNFNGLLLYSQCYIILARLKSETRGALFPASFPGLF